MNLKTCMLASALMMSTVAYGSVSTDGVITAQGKGILGQVSQQIVPAGWKVKFSDPYLAGIQVEWQASPWAEQWDTISTKNRLNVLADGFSKTVIISRADSVSPASFFIINSNSPSAEDYLWSKKIARANLVTDADISKVVKTVSSKSVETQPISNPQMFKESPVQIANSPVAHGVTPPIQTTAKSATFVPLKPVGNSIQASSLSVQKTNTAVNPPSYYLQSKLPQPDYPYLALVGGPDDRFRVSNGELEFLIKTGPLIDNIKALMAKTSGTNVRFLKVSISHKFPNNFWVKGDGVLSILDQMVAPFYIPKPIKWSAKSNNMVVVSYSDGENNAQ
ncbi:hypothetical protein ACEUAI_18730 [Aeromonas veronii]